MDSNFLQLNTDKTQVLVTAPDHISNNITADLVLLTSNMKHSAKNVGVHLNLFYPVTVTYPTNQKHCQKSNQSSPELLLNNLFAASFSPVWHLNSLIHYSHVSMMHKLQSTVGSTYIQNTSLLFWLNYTSSPSSITQFN